MDNNLVILLSLLNLGFFGGFSHCSGMCGPFVFGQVSNRLKKISIDDFSWFKKIRSFALFPYHLGRITTYSIIGATCSFLTKSIESFYIFKNLSAFLMIISAGFFAGFLFDKKMSFQSLKLAKLFNNFIRRILPKKIFILFNNLFSNPEGFKGYLLGILLGFIPCGLLYNAFLLSASISNPIIAMFGMFLFGIGNFPSLFLTAFTSSFIFNFKNKELKKTVSFFTKILFSINIVALILMSAKLIF
jgi:hypothetical protein